MFQVSQTPMPPPTAGSSQQGEPNAWSTMGPKLLEWPFLLFVLAILTGIVFVRDLKRLLSRRDIRIKWGDQEIQLRDLSINLDKELEPLRDEVGQLTAQLAGTQAPVPNAAELSQAFDLASIRRQLHAALENSEFKWRSIERLAIAAGTDQETAVKALRSDPEVRISRSKAGRQIAGLRSRVGD